MDLLNCAASEKLSLPDFAYATQYVPMAAQYEPFGSFIIPPGQPCIVSGFAPMYASGQNALTVNGTTDGSKPSGTAFLGYMDAAGTVRYGMLQPQNNQAQTLSLAGLIAGTTYTAYIRFNYVPGVPQNRAYEAKPGQPQEYAQLTQTRLQAIWELRIEVATLTMSPEWLPIATVAIGQGSTPTTVTDTRLLYFEGAVAANYAPAWGTTADRSTTRASASTGAAKITNLFTELDAIRQCLVDIKGPGLQPWQSSCIGGMNIGGAFNATPATGKAVTSPLDATVALGDMGFLVQGLSAIAGNTGPKISFDALTSGGSLFYNRTAHLLTYNYGAPGAAATAYVGIASNGYVGIGTSAAAPLTRLHVASNGMQPARFDAGSTSAGQAYTYLNGYVAGDKVVYAIGDGVGGTYTQRWGMGQLSAGVFGLQNAQAGTNFYTYNAATSNVISSFVYTRASASQSNLLLQGSYSYTPAASPVIGQHNFSGYLYAPNGATVNGQLVGNFFAANVVAVNGSSGGQRQPGFVMGTNTTLMATTSAPTYNNIELSGDMFPLIVASFQAYGTNPGVIQQTGKFNITNVKNQNGNCLITFDNNLPASAVILISSATPNQTGSTVGSYSQGPGANQLTVIFSTSAGGPATPGFSLLIYALGY